MLDIYMKPPNQFSNQFFFTFITAYSLHLNTIYPYIHYSLFVFTTLSLPPPSPAILNHFILVILICYLHISANILQSIYYYLLSVRPTYQSVQTPQTYSFLMQPLRVVLRNHKVLTTLGFVGVAGGCALIKERNRYDLILFTLPF